MHPHGNDHGCSVVKGPSSAAVSLLPFGTSYKMRMGTSLTCLKRTSIAKVNNPSTLSANTNSSVCIAEYRHTSSRPTRRRNKLRPKMLNFFLKPLIVVERDKDNSNIFLGNSESNKNDNTMEDTLIADDPETIATVAKTSISEIDLDDREASIDAFSDETKFITDTFTENGTCQIIAATETPKKGLKDQLSKMWDAWKDWHALYREDIREWGVGNRPIFVVYESGRGDVVVSINENEIDSRCEAFPNQNKIRVLKMTQAKKLALDIETGVFKPPRHSTIYEFVNKDKSDIEKGGLFGSVLYHQVTSSPIISTASTVGKISLVGVLVLCSSLFVWAAWKYVLCNAPFSVEDKQTIKGKDEETMGLKLQISRAKEKKKQLGMKSSKPSIDEDGLEFKKRNAKILDMAKQAAVIKQNNSQEQEKDYSNSKTGERNSDDWRTEEDYLSNFKLLMEKAHDLMDPDALDLNVLGDNGKSNEVNINVHNTLLDQQVKLKDFSQGSAGSSSIHSKEDGNSNGKSKSTKQLQVDVLQNGQNSAERTVENVTKEVNVRQTGKRKGVTRKDKQTIKGKDEETIGLKLQINRAKEKKKQLGMKSLKPSIDEDKLEFKKRNAEILDMARQDAIIKQNNSQEQGKDYSNSKTGGRNSDDWRTEEDHLSNFNLLMEKAHDFMDPDALDLNFLGDNSKSNEVNINVHNTLLDQQVELKDFSQGSAGSSSIYSKEDRNSNGKSKGTKQQQVDVLQNGQNSAERTVENVTKEVNVQQTGKKKGVTRKIYSVKGSHRITPQVITYVKEAREMLPSKQVNHDNGSIDTSNLSNKSTFLVEAVGIENKSAITKEETNSNGRTVRKRRKRLKAAIKRVKNDVEVKSARRKRSENFVVNHLETDEDKARIDFGNTRDTSLQIDPENGVKHGNNVLIEEAEELEWMRDEVLRKIVSKVEDNHNAGREPFDGLVSKEELLFFRGLERKFEREGEAVKIWIKERVENLKHEKDFSGIDGLSIFSSISLKDSTKEGRSITSSKINKDHKIFTTEKMGVDKENSSLIAKPVAVSVSAPLTSTNLSSIAIDTKHKNHRLDMPIAEEAIEYASFSTRGKLKNHETVRKPTMVGQKKTVNEYKQEMKNLLWWLDLPYVLCIGIYSNNEDNELKGLYSLEMAPVSGSPSNHTIAFEDHANARNFCYILQSHFIELGDTSACVIPLSTKDLYEEAKSTASTVTVIKKGDLQLYVGQPLKEVESKIIKIGNAM